MDPLERYQLESELGHGGVGEVHLALDKRIGRRVALKFLKPDAKNQKVDARFEREVRLQGQLEHPSIVPVYDVITSAEGHTYFAMRHVRGVTLTEVLKKLRARDEQALAGYTTHKLLSCFVSICLAVDFAHQRGVVHRDLKPSNIMLGDFGEAYLLDWGIAKVGAAETEEEAAALLGDTPLVETQAGAMLGTPGFMAPEQLRRDPVQVGPAADVYALGAILFEILTLHSLHPRTTMFAVVESTLAGAEAEISLRYPELGIAPELEAACVRATQLEPGDRYASARELASAIEVFLEGKRDALLRSKMAEEAAALGREAATGVRDAPQGGHLLRSNALRHFTRALSLDPENQTAQSGLAALLTDVPSEPPEEARAEMERFRLAVEHTGTRRGRLVIAAGLASTMVLFTLPVLNAAVMAAFAVLLVCMGVLAQLAQATARVRPSLRAARRYANLAVGLALLLVAGQIYGSLVMVPSVAATMLVPFVSNEARWRRPWVIAAFVLVIALPPVLASLGVIPGAYTLREGALVILPQAVSFTEPQAIYYLWAVNVLVVSASGYLVSGLVTRANEATDRLQLQAWYLRQMVPELADAMRAGRSDRAGA